MDDEHRHEAARMQKSFAMQPSFFVLCSLTSSMPRGSGAESGESLFMSQGALLNAGPQERRRLTAALRQRSGQFYSSERPDATQPMKGSLLLHNAQKAGLVQTDINFRDSVCMTTTVRSLPRKTRRRKRKSLIRLAYS